MGSWVQICPNQFFDIYVVVHLYPPVGWFHPAVDWFIPPSQKRNMFVFHPQPWETRDLAEMYQPTSTGNKCRMFLCSEKLCEKHFCRDCRDSCHLFFHLEHIKTIWLDVFFGGRWFTRMAYMGSDSVAGDCDEDELPEMSQVLVWSWQVPLADVPSVTSATRWKNNILHSCCATLFALLVFPIRCQSQNYYTKIKTTLRQLSHCGPPGFQICFIYRHFFNVLLSIVRHII